MRNCDKCHKELESVFPDRNRRSNDLQYEDALVIFLHGGYGMFFDDLSDLHGGREEFVICSDCAKVLLAQNEWLITPIISEVLEMEKDEENS